MLLPICFQSVVCCVAQAFFHYQLESSHKLGRGNSFPGLDKRYFILVYSEPEWQDIAGKKSSRLAQWIWNAAINKNMTICMVDSLIFLLVHWTGCVCIRARCIKHGVLLKDIYFYLVDVIFGSPCNTNSICQISALIEPNLSTHIFQCVIAFWVVAERCIDVVGTSVERYIWRFMHTKQRQTGSQK